jgi:hypothetical protein
MTERRPHPSDLSDARQALIEPVLSAWRAERRGSGLDIGRPPEHDLRAVMNAILYVDRTGIPWHYLPHDKEPGGLVGQIQAFRVAASGSAGRPIRRARPPGWGGQDAAVSSAEATASGF